MQPVFSKAPGALPEHRLLFSMDSLFGQHYFGAFTDTNLLSFMTNLQG